MTTEARWAAEAIDDLETIYHYYESERPAMVPGLMRAFLRTIELIETFPRSAPLALPVLDGREYRAATAHNHTIYYRVVGEDVLIAHIWDSRRGVPPDFGNASAP